MKADYCARKGVGKTAMAQLNGSTLRQQVYHLPHHVMSVPRLTPCPLPSESCSSPCRNWSNQSRKGKISYGTLSSFLPPTPAFLLHCEPEGLLPLTEVHQLCEIWLPNEFHHMSLSQGFLSHEIILGRADNLLKLKHNENERLPMG